MQELEKRKRKKEELLTAAHQDSLHCLHVLRTCPCNCRHIYIYIYIYNETYLSLMYSIRRCQWYPRGFSSKLPVVYYITVVFISLCGRFLKLNDFTVSLLFLEASPNLEKTYILEVWCRWVGAMDHGPWQHATVIDNW